MSRRDVAEDMQRKPKWPRDVVEDDLVLGIPKLGRKERHAIKGSPQSAPRRKGEYSRTRIGVQCRSSSRKNYHLRIECANKRPDRINGERTPEQCGDKEQGKGCHYCNYVLCAWQSHAIQFLQPPPTTLGIDWWDKYQPYKAEPTRGRWGEGKN